MRVLTENFWVVRLFIGGDLTEGGGEGRLKSVSINELKLCFSKIAAIRQRNGLIQTTKSRKRTRIDLEVKKTVTFFFNDACVVKMRKVAFLVVDLLFKKV